MRRVAIIQSSYIPWKGYFDIINDVDEFVFLDHVQFTTRDWRTRNRIKTRDGLQWLSIPAGSDRNRRISDVRLQDPAWQEKHWKSLAHAYGKAPCFAQYRSFFEETYLGQRWESLSQLNQTLTRRIATELLGIDTRFTDSERYRPEGSKLDLILDIARKAGATTYISGPSAADYIDSAAFRAAGIDLAYKQYSGYPEYPQLHGGFEHAVSILDLLFNVGRDSPWYIWGWRNDPPCRND